MTYTTSTYIDVIRRKSSLKALGSKNVKDWRRPAPNNSNS